MTLRRIVSGGQNGVDQAALDAAMRFAGFEWGGWCPKGRLQDGGQIPDRFFTDGKNGLEESDSSRYQERTKLNIRESDATLILVPGRVRSPGTKLTLTSCRKAEKHYRMFHPYRNHLVPRAVRWIVEEDITVLNVAGPREANNPGLQKRSTQFLSDILHYVFVYQRWGIQIWNPKTRSQI